MKSIWFELSLWFCKKVSKRYGSLYSFLLIIALNISTISFDLHSNNSLSCSTSIFSLSSSSLSASMSLS